MRRFLITIASIILALFTGWITMVIIANYFCSGYQPNWLCSDHGGGIVGIGILSVLPTLPIYIILLAKYLKNGTRNT